MLTGFSDHMMNSGITSAEWKRDRGGHATTARLTSSTRLPRPVRLPPCKEAPPRPRGAVAGVAVCLQGRPRPLLGGGEPGPSWRAFPFSAAESLFAGAMGVAAGSEARKKKEQEKQRKRWVMGAVPPLPIYSQREANRRPP